MNYRRVLVFGAHPDDEMTMAGTIRKLSDLGVEVHVCISTDGCEGYPYPEWKDRIVEMRRAEGEEADRVLGVHQRHHIGSPDMGLVNDKETLLKFLALVRKVRPDAAFTHGPDDRNRDHTNTSALSLEALWQGGEPVSREHGEPWRTRHIYFYKSVAGRPPQIAYDCTGYAHMGALARATQVSQHVLFGRTREEFEAEARRLQEAGGRHVEHFWITDRMALEDFPPVARQAEEGPR